MTAGHDGREKTLESVGAKENGRKSTDAAAKNGKSFEQQTSHTLRYGRRKTKRGDECGVTTTRSPHARTRTRTHMDASCQFIHGRATTRTDAHNSKRVVVMWWRRFLYVVHARNTVVHSTMAAAAAAVRGDAACCSNRLIVTATPQKFSLTSTA